MIASAEGVKAIVRYYAATRAWMFGFIGCSVLLCWAGGNWFSTVQRDIRDFVPLPELDYWETVTHIPRYEAFDPSVLWEQHYEHRIVLPELVFATDYLVFQGRQILPATLNVLLQFVALLLFGAAALWGSKRIPRLPGFAAVCLAGIFLAWPGVTYVLSYPFLLQWLFLQVAVLGALLLIARGKLAGTIAAGVIATFSSANGLALWPILVLFAVLRGESVRRVGILAAAGAICIAAFFTGYHDLHHFNASRSFSRPLYLAAYFLTYLSMPFGAVDTASALIGGVCSLLALAALLVIAWRKRLFTAPAAVVGFGVCGHTLLTIFMTSMSRLPFDRSWQDAAVTPGHYLNVSLHFWAAFVILTAFVLSQAFRSPIPSGLFLSVFALCAAGQQARMGPWMHFWLKRPAMYRYASLALESGVESELAYSNLYYSDPRLVARSLPLLASRRLAIYSFPRYAWVGRPASLLFRLAEAPRASGRITSVTPISSGFAAAGWAAGRWSELVLLNEYDTIVGLGERFGNEWPDLAPIPADHSLQGWIGFSRSPAAKACVLSHDRKSALCFAR